MHLPNDYNRQVLSPSLEIAATRTPTDDLVVAAACLKIRWKNKEPVA